MVLAHDKNPDYQPTLRDYLKYAADRAVEEGHTNAGFEISISAAGGGPRTDLTYSDLTR